MRNKPRGLEGAAKGPVYLIAANPLLAGAHQEGRLEPLVQLQVAGLKYRALADGKLLAAPIALPEAINGDAIGVALGSLGLLDGKSLGLSDFPAVRAVLRRAISPQDALKRLKGGFFIVEIWGIKDAGHELILH